MTDVYADGKADRILLVMPAWWCFTNMETLIIWPLLPSCSRINAISRMLSSTISIKRQNSVSNVASWCCLEQKSTMQCVERSQNTNRPGLYKFHRCRGHTHLEGAVMTLSKTGLKVQSIAVCYGCMCTQAYNFTHLQCLNFIVAACWRMAAAVQSFTNS